MMTFPFTIAPLVTLWVIWIFIPGNSLGGSFVHDTRNLTIIYKPNTFIYHLCQTTDPVNSKRIRWEYESFYHATNDFNSTDCFDIYYGPSTSLLVVKDAEMFSGKYACHVNINATYHVKSTGWIEMKFPMNEINQFINVYNENQSEKLAHIYNVPFIIDDNDLALLGKRIEIGGIFESECRSVESSSPIDFIWIHLKNSSKGIKTVQFVQHDGEKVFIQENRSSSSLSIYSVDLDNDGDYICIASNAFGRSFSRQRSLILSDVEIKPSLSYTDLQSRSVILHWHVLNDRLSHFIVYYRPVNHFDEMIEIEDYEQLLVHSKSVDYRFTFRIIDLIPFTKYEFRIKGFIGISPLIYSNPIVIETLETLPDKIDHLHGYRWNETSVVVHWTPPNATNGPTFYYVLFYTTNTSVPFNRWSNITIRTYPFHILTLPISMSSPLFIRVASVNAKGLSLSNFYMINDQISSRNSIPIIHRFRCSANDENQLISLEWSLNNQSDFHLAKYLLYYSDLTEHNNDLIRLLTIPTPENFFQYQFNLSSFNFNFNPYHLLRFHLVLIDENRHQYPNISLPTYCILSRKIGKNNQRLSLSIDQLSRMICTYMYIFLICCSYTHLIVCDT